MEMRLFSVAVQLLQNLVLETQSPETSVAFFLLYKVWVMRLGAQPQGNEESGPPATAARSEDLFLNPKPLGCISLTTFSIASPHPEDPLPPPAQKS